MIILLSSGKMAWLYHGHCGKYHDQVLVTMVKSMTYSGRRDSCPGCGPGGVLIFLSK